MPSSSASRSASWPLVYLAVALTTAASLLLELSLSRIFSVVFEYPAAFLTTTLALCGTGVGGVLAYVLAPETDNAYRKLGKISLLNAALALLVALVALRGTARGGFEIVLVCVLGALPFVGSGVILATAVAETVEQVDRVYGWGLLGAAAACLAAVGLMNTIGGPNTVMASSVIFTAAAAIWFSLGGRRLGRVVSVGVGLYFTLLVIANIGAHFVEVKYAKGRKLQAEQFSKWNRISRVGVGQDGSLSIDGIAVGKIATVKQELLTDGAGSVYRLHPGAKTLVIGADGGLNVARALASGSRDVTVVERNPILASTVMREKFAELSERLYLRPDVHVQVEDGRNFLRSTAEKYQLIHVTLPEAGAWTEDGVARFAAARMGTTEAFQEYFAHLTPDGVLALTGWEVSQVMEPAARALKDLGHTMPQLNVEADGEKAKTVTFRLNPLPTTDVQVGRPPMGTPAEPASDNKPFPNTLSALRPEASPAVIAAVGVLLGIVGFGAWLSRAQGVGGLLPYFPVVGLGAVIVQVALVHDFVLYFGRPTYALTTVTFSMLLWNAAGSFAGRWLVADRAVRLRVALAVAAGVVGATAFALPPMLVRSSGLPLTVKMAIAALLLAPAGFITGLPFPAGLRMLGRRHEAPVRWAWAMHSAAGVLGSAAALGLAVQFGITVTLLVGVGCYLVALGVAARGWLMRAAS